ncbi:hypothetical protein HMPREF1557_01449 [Streptococcus sobrinus W1703]|uniref:Uncharacterized protein n=1 Tax=Streptococcus sobrinus W1703 TaxID=1227275 RepID=U2KIT3_9STRE|nr:hypothetical protein HMPREF1557_01449 [Streptococcus sobrinus W1703]
MILTQYKMLTPESKLAPDKKEVWRLLSQTPSRNPLFQFKF